MPRVGVWESLDQFPQHPLRVLLILRLEVKTAGNRVDLLLGRIQKDHFFIRLQSRIVLFAQLLNPAVKDEPSDVVRVFGKQII